MPDISLVVLSAAPMFSRCVRVFELSSVNRSHIAPPAQSVSSELADGLNAAL
jgi:hypothetical protein